MSSDLQQLYEQAPSSHGPADLRQTLVPMLDGLSRALGYERALVALYDQERGALRGSVGLNVTEAIAELLDVPLSAEADPLVIALLDGTPQRIDDVQRDPRLTENTRELLLELGMNAAVVAPRRSGVPGVSAAEGVLGGAGAAGTSGSLMGGLSVSDLASIGETGGFIGSGATSATSASDYIASLGGAGESVRSAPPLGTPAVVPITAATWQGNELPAVGVILLSKEKEAITDQDIEWLMPFANQAGVALARATDVELLRSSSEEYAIENEWLWAMINAVDDPVVVTDVENNIVVYNRRAETIFRSHPEDSEGKRHAIWMNNFLFTAGLSTWNLEQGGVRSNQELTLVDPIDGSELTFDVISYPVTHYRLGGQRGVVSVLRNVTDLRRATEQLTENVQQLQSRDEEIRLERDRLDLILGSVPNPILVLDTDNQPLRMNREALRLFHPASATAGAAVTRKGSIALSNETKFTSFLAQLRLEKDRVKSGELALVDPDSEESLAMWVTATEIHDALGAVTAVVAVMQNLAPLRELERVRVEQALFESEKLAATGRLAASIAHEINNPLEVIKNSLYLLVNKIPEEDPNHKFLQLAKSETERMSRILRDMLGMYRQTTSMTPTDVNALIEDAESLVVKLLRQKGVRLENDFAAVPQVSASPDQLKQVILNLLLNAQQAMPQGGTVYVSTRHSANGDPDLLSGDAVHIMIRDTGTGISEEHMPHIFEPFFSTKTDGQKGTGLGLWVSYGIVRNHGGRIRVRSRAGHGTVFTISLPTGGPPADGQPSASR